MNILLFPVFPIIKTTTREIKNIFFFLRTNQTIKNRYQKPPLKLMLKCKRILIGKLFTYRKKKKHAHYGKTIIHSSVCTESKIRDAHYINIPIEKRSRPPGSVPAMSSVVPFVFRSRHIHNNNIIIVLHDLPIVPVGRVYFYFSFRQYIGNENNLLVSAE